MPDYIGRDDLHFCIKNERLVLLDAVADSYMCLDRASTAAVLPLIRSADTGLILSGDAVTEEARAIVNSMLQRGLLLESENIDAVGRDRYRRGLRPRRALQRYARTPAKYAHLHRFLHTSTRASLQLRCRSFGAMLEAVRSRKMACVAKQSGASESHVALLVERFRGLRPLYPRPYLCLFDSLALLEWLLHHGIAAQWVFGVRADPFLAHCWLQIDDLALNNSLEHAREFEPIMVV